MSNQSSFQRKKSCCLKCYYNPSNGTESIAAHQTLQLSETCGNSHIQCTHFSCVLLINAITSSYQTCDPKLDLVAQYCMCYILNFILQTKLNFKVWSPIIFRVSLTLQHIIKVHVMYCTYSLSTICIQVGWNSCQFFQKLIGQK